MESRDRVPTDTRSRELMANARREFEANFDAELSMICFSTQVGKFHYPRESLAYALCLLLDAEREHWQVAEGIIARVLTMQECRPENAHYGNFRWLYEDPVVIDLNGVEFMVEAFTDILLRARDRLSAETLQGILAAVRLGLEEIGRLDVHLSYTNIALLDIRNSILGGELLGDDHFSQRGYRRLDEWAAFTSRSGAPYEFNSPTYCGVDLDALAAIAQHSSNATARLKACLMEERLWLHVAAHFHRPTHQLAGPHSRAYRRDVTGAPGRLKNVLYKVLGDPELCRNTPYYTGPRYDGDVGIALTEYHCPDYILSLFDKPDAWEVRETASNEPSIDLTSYLTADYCLGTASRAYGVGEPLEPWPQHDSLILYYRRDSGPGYGVLYCRYLSDERGIGEARGSGPTGAELFDEGLFCGVQSRNRAIVAYGLFPRGLRITRSERLDIRLLGPDADSELRAGEQRFEGEPLEVQPREPVLVADGRIYLAIIPLEPTAMGQEAPILLRRDGGETILSIYNYRDAPKDFWEYRSLAGPFYKGNVRNAFILEVASRQEYSSLEDFRRHIQQTTIQDLTGPERVREITYRWEDGSLSLAYSLWDMRTVERRVDGKPYSPPMLECPAAEQAAGRAQVGTASVEAGSAPVWLVSDEERQLWVAAKPDDAPARLRMETPQGVLEAEGFGFGKVTWDGAERSVQVECAASPGGVRVQGEEIRLVVTGAQGEEQ